MMRSMLAVVALGSWLLVTGCRSPAELNAIVSETKTRKEFERDYVIGEGDQVEIRILGTEHEFTGSVRPDGKIAFPYQGDVDVKGRTVAQLRKELERRFQRPPLGISDPTVYVNVTAYTSAAITVLGEVGAAGRFPYTGQMRVSDLLGIARGVRITAAPNRTLLFREVDGKLKVYKVLLKDFLHKADFTTNYYLRPGDIVYVPLNGFSKVARSIEIGVSPLRALLSFINVGNTTTNLFVP